MALTEEILAGVPKPKPEAEIKEGGDALSQTTPTTSSSQSEDVEGGRKKEARRNDIHVFDTGMFNTNTVH